MLPEKKLNMFHSMSVSTDWNVDRGWNIQQVLTCFPSYSSKVHVLGKVCMNLLFKHVHAGHDGQGDPARDAKLNDGQKSKVSRAEQASGAALEDKYHVVASVDGGLYTEWQVRICYYHYKKMLRDFPDSAMGGFTRLLHR